MWIEAKGKVGKAVRSFRFYRFLISVVARLLYEWTRLYHEFTVTCSRSILWHLACTRLSLQNVTLLNYIHHAVAPLNTIENDLTSAKRTELRNGFVSSIIRCKPLRNICIVDGGCRTAVFDCVNKTVDREPRAAQLCGRGQRTPSRNQQ